MSRGRLDKVIRDKQGNLVSGVTVTVYEAIAPGGTLGTTPLATLYVGETGAAEEANPITTGLDGAYGFWLEDGAGEVDIKWEHGAETRWLESVPVVSAAAINCTESTDWGLISVPATAKQVQLRRGNTAENAAFTGAEAELVIDTTKYTAVIHDGATAGGFALAREFTTTLWTKEIAVAGGQTVINIPVPFDPVTDTFTLSLSGVQTAAYTAVGAVVTLDNPVPPGVTEAIINAVMTRPV